MKQNTPSLTAYKVAVMRAAHQIFDTPKVFEDPIALSIIGAQGASDLRSKNRSYKTKLHRYLRAFVVARSRFVENELDIATMNGVRQYVILGAGLDTFAYRNPHSAKGLRVFEVDHPATQQWKRKQLNAADIQIPETLTFVSTDFENLTLADKLIKEGFKTEEPSFFSWLGVTMYLSREKIMETMAQIFSSTSSGSEIVFDYIIHPSSQHLLRRLIFFLLFKKVEKAGEPWKSFFDPMSLAMALQTIGFTHAEDIGPEKINALFFKDRTDKLKVGEFGHLMKVHV